jgi:hypothetical protein
MDMDKLLLHSSDQSLEADDSLLVAS